VTELVDVTLLAVVVVLVQSAHTADLWKTHVPPVLKTTT
jgi:hypothetical protein